MDHGRGFGLFWDQEALAGLRSRLQKQDPALLEAIVRSADKLLLEGVPLLGWGRASLLRPVPWHADACSGITWPMRFHKLIDIVREGEPCDVKYPWELSRLQGLPVIAGAWVLSGDPRYFTETWDLLLDWSSQNPEGYGVNWTCSMEVAIRAINLAAVADLLDSGASPAQRKFLARLLRAHEHHLRWNLEVSDVSGNHLFFDYLGIALLSLLLDGASSDRFRKAAEILAGETDAQFHVDGVHLEHATGYQRLMLEGVLLYLIAARHHGVKAENTLWAVAKRARAFLEAISDARGAIPAIGDSDSGNVLTLGGVSGNHAAPLFEYFAAVGLGGLATKGCLDASARAWFSHLGGLDTRGSEAAPAKEAILSLASFEDAGYFVIRNRDLLMVLRAGPSGLGGRGSHDHNDQLSFVFSLGGRPVLIDPGTSTYTSDVSQHAWDLATAHHNTVSLAGLEQSPIQQGSVTCTVRNARGRCESFTQDGDGRILWSGSVPYGGTLKHLREVTVAQTGADTLLIEIRDLLHCAEDIQRPAAAHFLLHPDFRVKVAGDGLGAEILLEGVVIARFEVVLGGQVAVASDTAALEYGRRWDTTRLSVPLAVSEGTLVRFELPISAGRGALVEVPQAPPGRG